MNLIETINKRDSCRLFLNKPIDKKLIKEIIQISTRAPSARNCQPWRFLILSNKKRKILSKMLLDQLENNNSITCAKEFGKESCKFYNCPTVIIISMDKNQLNQRLIDVGIIIGYLSLIFEFFGLSSCPIGLVVPLFTNDIKKYLKIEKQRVVLTIAIGYRKKGSKKEQKTNRRNIDNVIKWEN